MECWSFFSLKSTVKGPEPSESGDEVQASSVGFGGFSAATEDLTQRPWWEWDCGKAAQDLTSAQAKRSAVVQGLRKQSQAGLLLLLCWEEELEEEGEGKETEL